VILIIEFVTYMCLDLNFLLSDYAQKVPCHKEAGEKMADKPELALIALQDKKYFCRNR